MNIIPKEVIDSSTAAGKQFKIPASVIIAQWALESNWGKLMSGKFNYGGITAKVSGSKFPYTPGTPLEPATLCWTHEVVSGKKVTCQRWFKDFTSPDAFFVAHAKLLGTSPTYAKARAKLPDVSAFVDALGPTYATDPNYAKTVKNIIATNGLIKYD